MAREHFDVAVVGAGMVGVCCAMWLQRSGKRVVVLDKNTPGNGTSYGNAGTYAPFGCVPINSPQLVKSLPGLLFSKSSPLNLDWAYAATHLPWMLSFLKNCAPDKVEHTTASLANILAHVDAGFDPLVSAAGAGDLVVSNGAIYVFGTEAAYEKAIPGIAAREQHGVAVEVLDADPIREMEPSLRMPIHKGMHFSDARHVLNPKGLIERLFKKFLSDGGSWRQREVGSVKASADIVEIDCNDADDLTCGQLVVAAGAHSKSIKGSGAEKLPLDCERGYHIVFKGAERKLSRVVGWQEYGFNATPMEGGLRIAGTVEIAGLQKPLNPERIDFLTDKAHRMFDGLGEPNEEWLGHRPTLPDSLPVISHSPRSERILLAFGHHHIGLTLGGITGRIIADLAEGRVPNFDISAYSAARFTR
ncbi:MAG: FAD-binding oxidoreductase [Alphaproteobacteria bacterium]|nr:FAD-binding oxidoreductase [Alphaproteobacteria bacterium]